MVIDMSEQKLVTLAQLRQFVEGTEGVEFQGCGPEDQRYGHIESVVRRFGYRGLGRADKGLVVRYLVRTTGYSRQQITRLLKRARGGAKLKKAYRAPAKGFVRRFGPADVALLDLTHALILDQCHRGQGYPVVLSEAHEQAVVSGADREFFWEMVDNELAEAGMDGAVSAKSFSKRTRWV